MSRSEVTTQIKIVKIKKGMVTVAVHGETLSLREGDTLSVHLALDTTTTGGR